MSDVGRVGWSPGYGFHEGSSPFAGQTLGSFVDAEEMREQVREQIEEAARQREVTTSKSLQAEVNDLADWAEAHNFDTREGATEFIEHVLETLRRIRT